jgi:O-antigen ligase
MIFGAAESGSPAIVYWRSLRWAPALIAAVITLEVAIGGANGWATRPAAALANAAVAALILLATDHGSRIWVRMRVPFLLFVAALLWALLPHLMPMTIAAWIGVPANPAPDRLWPELAEAISRLTLVMAAAAASYRLGAARPFVLALALAGALYAGWMICTPLPWRFLTAAGQGRFAATIGNWNAAGAYFGMIAALCLAAILARGRARHWGWHALFALPLLATLLLCMATQSRSAFTLTAMALAIGLVWHGRAASLLASKRQALTLIVPITLAAMMVAYLGAGALFPRYLALSADGLSRWDIITTYFGYTLESPLWGFGPGSFFEVNQARLTTATALRFWNFGAAHNAALQIALEAGWPALLLLAVGVIAIGRDVARRSWGAEDIGLIGALGIAAGASMVDIAWNVPAIGAFSCVLLGVLWGARPAHAPTAQLRRRSSTGRARGVPVTS